MRLTAIFIALFLCTSSIQTATAQGFLDRINNAIDTVESTTDTVNRTVGNAENTAERLNDITPAAGTEEDTISAEEARILKRAEEIKQKQEAVQRSTNRSRRRY